MIGYKGSRLSVIDMLDVLVECGKTAHSAGQEIRRAIEDGAIILWQGQAFPVPLKVEEALKAGRDIERVAAAYAAFRRGERVGSSEIVWQQYLRETFVDRAQFDSAFGLSAETKPAVQSKARQVPKQSTKGRRRFPGDAALVEEARRYVRDGCTKAEAARRVADRAEGGGTPESRRKRIERKLGRD